MPVGELPKIVTVHATTRLPARHDADAIVEYYKANAERFRLSSPKWPDDFLTKRFWQKHIDRYLEDYYAGTAVRFFAFADDSRGAACLAHVGVTGIMRSAAQSCYLGYGISEPFEGKGIMHEILQPVIDFTFAELNLHRITAAYLPGNERSGRLLQRLGFTVEGFARDYLYLDGQWRDHVVASIINGNWKPPV